MKYKLFGLSVSFLVVVIAAGASVLGTDSESIRYHQHLEARQPDAGCDCTGDVFCTHLPLVRIETGGTEIPGDPILDENGTEIGYTHTATGEEMLSCRIEIINNETRNNHPGDIPESNGAALIRTRGNSSRYFDKKSYLIRYTKTDGTYENRSVMGMDAHYEWALHGPYLDKSLIRNYMWYNIAGEIMDYAPNVRFCEVFLNGEYRGIYVMTETLTNGEDCRLDISEPLENTDKTGYLLRLDRGSTKEIKNIKTFLNYALRNRQNMDIKYPRSGDLTPELARAITQEYSDFEKALYSYDYDTNNHGYQTMIDTGSFVDYFIINEFTTNYDAGWLSTYIYKDVGGKYKLTIWDFNSACDNYRDPQTEVHEFRQINNIWYYMLFKDEDFCDHVIRRYRQLRKSYLSDDYLINYIDEVVRYLGPAIERNFTLWGYTFEQDMLSPAERNPKNHADAIAYIKDYIYDRGQWMDENIEILRQYGHASKVKKFNH